MPFPALAKSGWVSGVAEADMAGHGGTEVLGGKWVVGERADGGVELGSSSGCQGHSSLDAPSELNLPQRIPSPLLPHD